MGVRGRAVERGDIADPLPGIPFGGDEALPLHRVGKRDADQVTERGINVEQVANASRVSLAGMLGPLMISGTCRPCS